MTRKKKTLLIDLSIISVTLLLCGMILYFAQPSAFFQPYHDAQAYENLQQKEQFQEISIPHKKGNLHGWYYCQTETAPLLILYGGNMQNSSATMEMFEYRNVFSWFEGYNILFVDYPGYGLSDGKPTEKTLFSAALAVFDFAKNLDGTNGKIVILGYSIGTGVASYVASQRDVDGLILLAPFDRGLSLYNDALNIFHGPMKLLTRFKFDSASYAEEISVPTLIIASRDDEVIPYTHAVELGQYFVNLQELILLDGIGHDEFFYSAQVLESMDCILN